MRFFNYGMRSFNWAKDFEEYPIVEDIPRRVQIIEISYWFWTVISSVILIAGLMILTMASSTKMELFGMLIGLEGFIGIVLNGICASTTLASYRILWDTQNRLQREMNKMSSTDL